MSYEIKVTYRQRLVLDYLIKGGYTQAEIAKKLKCSASNVNQTIARLMKKYPKLNLSKYDIPKKTYKIPDEYVKKHYLSYDNEVKGEGVK